MVAHFATRRTAPSKLLEKLLIAPFSPPVAAVAIVIRSLNTSAALREFDDKDDRGLDSFLEVFDLLSEPQTGC
ncbi:hypothetical protein MUK42_37563 [Musa troglodytarum]|uniref:Uncharacterized protein n=1 Tax=Musa troglodytarum TaxID=320322 RepID=A0A9E7E9L5_9LILI|nr:hypothetical protein MUK42_37563 [Musa troglodytarum]